MKAQVSFNILFQNYGSYVCACADVKNTVLLESGQIIV
jgi:hypothetical protein